MSLPPEHISIKRRRQEEPVELLYLENDRQQTKRRVTEYCFQRVKAEAEVPAVSEKLPASRALLSDWDLSSRAASGVPVVRVTPHGAEITEEAERRAAQKALRNRYLPGKDVSKSTTAVLHGVQKPLPDEISIQRARPAAPVRRFHLYHDLKGSYTDYLSAIRKRKTARRSHLATFVERPKVSRRGIKLLDKGRSKRAASGLQDSTVTSPADSQPAEESSNPAQTRETKTGQSMHDHPSTRNYDSDQLAEELAAFALEVSQDEKRDIPSTTTIKSHDVSIKDINTNVDEEYTYDTYVRVPLWNARMGEEARNDVGLLVIDDEDQELWQTLAESEDSSEWDEEDPDSNAEDNPANEYPDEDIESDDEYGYGTYKHRKVVSDGEEYDLNDPWSNSE